MQVGTGFALYVPIVFVRQPNRLLGPGILLRYVFGQYHRPRREARIFMFLDLKSSTTLAEELRPEAYYDLVNEFCGSSPPPTFWRDSPYPANGRSRRWDQCRCVEKLNHWSWWRSPNVVRHPKSPAVI